VSPSPGFYFIYILYMSNIIFIPINELSGKIVCKYEQKRIPLKEGEGLYPKIGWVHESGAKIGAGDVKYKIIPISESPQFKFIMNDKNYYEQYMNITGWRSGYGAERIHAVKNFSKLIDTFDQYLGKKFSERYIECVKQNGKYVIVDGLHRSSIIYSKLKNKGSNIRVKVINCPNFINLPLK